jgi:uncharacterized protein DUF5069
MEPLDLSKGPPRSCYAELDGLMLMPRTIDKLRALLPGGNPGIYFISGTIRGISGYLMERLGITESDLTKAVIDARSDEDVAAWLRERVDTSAYPAINKTLRRIAPHHTDDPDVFANEYADTMRAHPELAVVIDIVDADDRRRFPIGPHTEAK